MIEWVARAMYEDMAADADDLGALRWVDVPACERVMWLEQAEVAVDAVQEWNRKRTVISRV